MAREFVPDDKAYTRCTDKNGRLVNLIQGKWKSRCVIAFRRIDKPKDGNKPAKHGWQAEFA